MNSAMLEQHAIEGVVPDITPATHPDHHTVGREFGGTDGQSENWKGVRWFCFSHDRAGYWMYATDGSGHWTNISERAIGRSFHEIYKEPGGRIWCPWFADHKVPTYTDRPTTTEEVEEEGLAHKDALQILEEMSRLAKTPADTEALRMAQDAIMRELQSMSPKFDEDGQSSCWHPDGHHFVCSGTQYGGDDESYHGEGRCYCEWCGADGDA